MEWKQFRNTNYYVNKLGQLKTINWKNSKKEKIMSPCINSSGYYQTALVINGKNISFKVHRIIAEVFILNPENKPEVNHINGNKLDNRIENLEWVTHKENIQHAIENNLFKHYIGGWNKGLTTLNGEQIGTSKLKEKEVLEIRNKFIPYKYTRKMLAKEYKVSELTIKDIIQRKTWKHI